MTSATSDSQAILAFAKKHPRQNRFSIPGGISKQLREKQIYFGGGTTPIVSRIFP
jgi:hypothetical protein